MDLFRDLGGLSGLALLIEKGVAKWNEYRFRRELRRRADQGDKLVDHFEDLEQRLEAAKAELLARSKRP